MPDTSIVIDGKKFMWDGEVYESEKDAREVMQQYEKKDFQVHLIQKENQYFASVAA